MKIAFCQKIIDKIMNKKKKRILILETNSACNVRCVWCSPQICKKHDSGFMTAEQFESIISKNIDYIRKNYSAICPYSRGEAFINPQIWNILEILKKYNLFDSTIEFHSNLSMPLDIDKIKKYNLRIVANFGGITKDVHEKVMKNSDFDLVCDNLKKLANNDVNIKAKITPTKNNIHQIDQFDNFIENIVGHKIPTIIGRTGIMIPYALSDEELDRFFDEIVSDEMKDYLRFEYDLSKPRKGLKSKQKKCPFLIDTIFYDGTFTICCHDKIPMINLGNVFEKSMAEITSSKEYKKARKDGNDMKLGICELCN